MENNERDRKLDQWLDEALSEYSAAEPRLGLEKRVLAQVAAEEKARAGRGTFWRWMPAFAAIAAVLIVMVAVRPYWQQKTQSPATFAQPAPAANPTADTHTAQTLDQTQPASQPSSARNESAKVMAIAPGKSESAGTRTSVARDGELADTANTAVASKTIRVAPSPAASNVFDVSSSAPAKEKDATEKFSANESRPAMAVHGNYSTILTTNAPAAPPPQPQKTGMVGGLVSGNVSAGDPVQARRAEAAYAAPNPVQTIEVSPSEQKLQMLNGAATNQKAIATMPVAAAQTNTMKGTPVGPLAKKLEENVDTVNIVGMPKLRTGLKTVPPGPIHQFPTPVPLSDEEKLMLKAAKEMKSKPANDDKQDVNEGQLKDIDIKKIEIAPLPGPPK